MNLATKEMAALSRIELNKDKGFCVFESIPFVRILIEFTIFHLLVSEVVSNGAGVHD